MLVGKSKCVHLNHDSVLELPLYIYLNTLKKYVAAVGWLWPITYGWAGYGKRVDSALSWDWRSTYSMVEWDMSWVC